MKIRDFLVGVSLAAGVGLIAHSAQAQIPYPTPGVQNTQNYSIVASHTGNLNVWFGGKGGASDTDVVTAIVNGTPTGIVGLNNQTSYLGEYFNLGHVNAGDTVVFEMEDLSSGNNWFTDNSLNIYMGNPDGNHAYFAPFAGGLVGSTNVPASAYFGFEDVPAAFSDLNYLDDQFYAKTGIVPEPSTWALLLIGFMGLGAALRQARPSLLAR